MVQLQISAKIQQDDEGACRRPGCSEITQLDDAMLFRPLLNSAMLF